jgi:hypothetical protein
MTSDRLQVVEASRATADEAEPGCIHCSLDFDFELPQRIVDAAKSDQLVIFAGAGISTEVPAVFPTTVYDMARNRLEIAPEGPEPSFPEAMQQFQDRHGRTELVRMIRDKFDYINNFPRLRYHARKFHEELATMPYLRELITTNWDTYFEEECGATPFVTGEDIALYGLPGRRVLKMHGSISNLASLVATEKDYAKRLEQLNTNVMGGLLRHLLATKTVVFVGYSLRDWNFRRLYSALRSDMKDYAPPAYLVSPLADDTTQDEEFKLTVLKTSGVKFLRELKLEMYKHCFISDEAYDKVEEFYDAIDTADAIAKTVPHKKYPAVVFCWFYHDGARDACFRIRTRRVTGEYSERHRVVWLCQSYENFYDNAIEEGRFHDAAYIDGYLNALTLLLSTEEENAEQDLAESVPYYFIFGAESAMRSVDEFHEALKQSRRRAPKARKQAKEISDGLPEGMVTSHSAFLPDVGRQYTR